MYIYIKLNEAVILYLLKLIGCFFFFLLFFFCFLQLRISLETREQAEKESSTADTCFSYDKTSYLDFFLLLPVSGPLKPAVVESV